MAIARVLAGDPRLILADEPTGNLDSLMTREIMDLLEHINGRGTTIVMVTHSPECAARAHRQIHLLDGRVVDLDAAPTLAPRAPARGGALGRPCSSTTSASPEEPAPQPGFSALIIVGGIALGIAVATLFSTVRHSFAKDPIPPKSDVLYYVRMDSWDPASRIPNNGRGRRRRSRTATWSRS